MIKTAIVLVGAATGIGFLSAITGTVLSFTGRAELEPYANMAFAGALMLVVLYTFFLGVSVIDASCFAPFAPVMDQVPFLKALRW